MAINISPIFNPKCDFVNYEGDVRDLLKTVPDHFFKLIITSPPYNLGKEYEKKKKLHNYLQEQAEIISLCVEKLRDDGSICWQVGNYVNKGEIIPLDLELYPIFKNLNLHLRNRIIWHFGHGLHASKRFSGRYEVILWFTKTEKYTFNLDEVREPQKYPQKKYFKGPKKGSLSGNPLGKNPSDVWEIPNVKANHVEKTEHPCQFPVELIERLVLTLSHQGDWILDPFMGVGTTAIASLMHGRKVVGAEIISDYVNKTKERLKMAESGTLRIRPMERPVFDPLNPEKNVPPYYVKIGDSLQAQLFREPQAEDY